MLFIIIKKQLKDFLAMSNVFSAPRFGKFFKYDLKKAYNIYGISIGVTAISPLIAYFFYQLCVLIIDGHFANFDDGMIAARIVLGIFFFINIFIFSPAKIYGNVTDKRFGSNYLLVPASTLEKGISMVLISAIIVPLISILLIAGVDYLMSVIFPNSFGESLFHYVGEFVEKICFELDPMNPIPMLTIGFLTGTLTYLLGGIIFKKSKIAKTILASFVIGCILMFLCTVLLKVFGLDYYFVINHDNLDFAKNFIAITYIIVILELAIILGAIYYRLRTIQH